MDKSLKRFQDITKAIYKDYYTDLGEIDFIDEDITLENIKISVVPYEGIHKDVKYIITIKFQEEGLWPCIYIDSEIYDKIKTNQYLKEKGRTGQHKGICIKNISYGYKFNENFEKLCGNKWENYIYNLICVFNNLQDFEKGNGIKSNYKNILSI
jgi:hypothetical protein